MAYKVYTKLEKTLMCELCRITNNVLYVSKITGAHPMTINKFLNEKDIKIHDEDKIFERDIKSAEIYNRVRNGETLKSISKDVGVDKHILSAKLTIHKKKYNKDRINAWDNITAEKDKEALEWFEAIECGTKTITQIADEKNMSISGVSRRIKRFLNRNNKNKDFRFKQ